jgi:hypothetical protein
VDIRHRDRFFKTRGFRRLRYVDRLTAVVSILGAVASAIAVVGSPLLRWNELTAMVEKLLEMLKSLFFDASKAHAAEVVAAAASASYDFRLLVNLGIMLSIAIAFFWSLGIMLHSANEGRVKTAGDINKMLLGFLIGSGKSFLGLG